MNQPPSDPRPSRNRDLGFDEFVAMLVAFATIGAVLWWGLSRKEAGLDLTGRSQPSVDQEAPASLFDRLTVPDEDASQASGITSSTQDLSDPFNSPPTFVSPAPERVTRATPSSAVPGVVALPPSPTATPVTPVSPTPDVPPVLVVPPPTASPVEFSDVPNNYWASPFILALAQRGIVTGFSDGTFQPDQPVTRAQYAALIENIFQGQNQQEAIAFQDVPSDFWATPAINTAVETGFMKGYPEGTFQPDQPIPRVQVLASLVSGLKIAQPSAPADVVKLYRDNEQIPPWAIPATASATAASMVVNYPAVDALNPNQPTTRAEVAAILHQALVAAGKLEAIPSDYIVRP